MPTLMGKSSGGPKHVAPEIDVRSAADARLAGVPDTEVLRRAAEQGQVLISQDRRTMPGLFPSVYQCRPSEPGLDSFARRCVHRSRY